MTTSARSLGSHREIIRRSTKFEEVAYVLRTLRYADMTMAIGDLRGTWGRRLAVATPLLLLALTSSIGGCRSRSKNSTMTPAPDDSSGTSREVSTGATTDATAPSGTPTKEPAPDTVAYTGAFEPATGYATLKVGGRDRRVYVYVPPRHSPKPPLVVAFHGTGGNMGDGAHDGAMSELSIREVADANGFVVVAPFSTNEGGVNADHETGGNGWRFDDDVGANVDLALTRASIQEARRAFRIDATHVYAVGMSNGAFFAYFAAMKLADRFAAFAESSGGLVPCGRRVDCEFRSRGSSPARRSWPLRLRLANARSARRRFRRRSRLAQARESLRVS